jgi:hypothetical protein
LVVAERDSVKLSDKRERVVKIGNKTTAEAITARLLPFLYMDSAKVKKWKGEKVFRPLHKTFKSN